MASYKIITDSTSDLTVEMAKEIDVNVIPFSFIMDGQNYEDNIDHAQMSTKTFYQFLREGKMPTTAQINSEEFADRFKEILDTGEDLLYIAFSSGLSGTYQSALIAKKELEKKYPDRTIMVFDSKAASMGQGLLVYHAAMLKKNGSSMQEVYTWLEENVMKLAHYFTVDDLNHLKRGGRLSAATAVLGTMLGIKPILNVDEEGHLIPISKVRGRKQSLDALVKTMEAKAIDPKDQVIFISHGDCLSDAEYVADEVKKRMNVKDIYINYIGSVIGTHAGPGTVALFFLADSR